jgi:hypothetical protein
VSTAESSSIGTAVVAIAIGAGFLWARASSRLPIPEVLKMLRAPVVSAVVSLVPVARWFLLNVRADRHVVTIQTVIKGTLVTFIAAIPVVAFPAVGWAFGLTFPAKTRIMRGTPWCVALTALLVGCGGPQVRAMSDYRSGILEGKRVLLVPLAVSDPLGDERTGIVLSDAARLRASAAACRRIAQDRDDGKVVCGEAAKSQVIAELELLFAKDQRIPSRVWAQLRGEFGTDYALLFRPESVVSSQQVGRLGDVSGTSPEKPVATAIVVTSLFANQDRTTTVNHTEVSYTLSASLVRAADGRLLKVGVHAGSASRLVEHNEGVAEAPAIEPLLESLMVDLTAELLDD